MKQELIKELEHAIAVLDEDGYSSSGRAIQACKAAITTLTTTTVTDADVQELAEKEYPYQYHKTVTILAQREAFIKGYTTALTTSGMLKDFKEGWIEIKSEKDLPEVTDETECYIVYSAYPTDVYHAFYSPMRRKFIEITDDGEEELRGISHYQIITKPTPPKQ